MHSLWPATILVSQNEFLCFRGTPPGVLKLRWVCRIAAASASRVPAALLRLEEIAGGKLCKPDVIILDLAFPSESGFEILRYMKSTPALKNISVVVWTAMDYTEQQLSSMFGVRKVVRKWAGASELEEAVRAAVAA